jgi:hypothetical protein
MNTFFAVIHSNKKLLTMAKPIKNTPILTGRDAVNFFAKMEENKGKKVDASRLLSIREDAQKLKSILTLKN